MLLLISVVLILSLLTTTILVWFFRKPIQFILEKLIQDSAAKAWSRYILFTLYVGGVAGGTKPWQFEKYSSPNIYDKPAIAMSPDRWQIEILRAIVETAEALVWMLLLFFMTALVAYIVRRAIEKK